MKNKRLDRYKGGKNNYNDANPAREIFIIYISFLKGRFTANGNQQIQIRNRVSIRKKRFCIRIDSLTPCFDHFLPSESNS